MQNNCLGQTIIWAKANNHFPINFLANKDISDFQTVVRPCGKNKMGLSRDKNLSVFSEKKRDNFKLKTKTKAKNMIFKRLYDPTGKVKFILSFPQKNFKLETRQRQKPNLVLTWNFCFFVCWGEGDIIFRVFLGGGGYYFPRISNKQNIFWMWTFFSKIKKLFARKSIARMTTT